ncbi:YjiH family protein [Eubacterium sp. AB3007]|uniref:YjiH family protein n=1 Tax=Eubacterium sp. AB3007 TaxID=1392487 RepID=UPI000691102E|nr:YjiH family protein [Eubacterium sp. AB3007]
MSEKKVFPPGADPGTDDEQITEVELEPVEQKNIVKFAIASLAGLFLFLIPIPRGTSFTIPIGILINWVSDLLELENVNLASVAVLLFITVSTVLTIINKLFHPAFLSRNEKVEKIFSPAPLYFVSRILGLIIVYMAFFKVGPKMIWSGATGGSMLGVSATLISVILCIAFLMPLLTDFGIMEFVGVFMRKVVRPLFTVPGRSAIDLVTSWLGTSNAAAILTTGQYEAGFYSAREAATISCNFSFVSIPFCYVIATLLGVEDKFTVFYLISLIGGVVLAMIIPRIPPLRFLPDSYDEISGKRIRENVPVGVSKTKWALNMAGHRAETANGKTVFNSGLHIYATMFLDLIPVVMSWGTIILILVEYTPIFNWISIPFGWEMQLCGIEGAMDVAPACLVGFADQYIPPLMLADYAIERTRFIVGCMSLLQIIYMTEVGLIVIKSRVPVNVGHLFLVFLERTVIAIPLVTLLTNLFVTF